MTDRPVRTDPLDEVEEDLDAPRVLSERDRERPEVLEDFARFQRTGDRALRNELVERYAGFAAGLARRFARRGEPLDDLTQVGLVGLLKAVERFDPGRGQRFEAFAAPTILGEIRRHFRDRGWTLRVPRRIQELHLQLDGVLSTCHARLGRSPTAAEIAEEAGVTVEDVLVAMEARHLYRPRSLDAPRRDQDGMSDPASRVVEEDPMLEGADDRLTVEQLLARLPERERTIVYLRFFEDLTQSEIAERVGLSQMHVSRLLARSLELLGRLRVARGL